METATGVEAMSTSPMKGAGSLKTQRPMLLTTLAAWVVPFETTKTV